MNEQHSNPDELGSLWIKTSAKGDEYMTGTVNGHQVVVFANTRKTPGSNQPDWRVMKSRPKGESPAPRQAEPPHVEWDNSF